MDAPPVARLAMPQSILVRAPNWLGDTVMALPFLASLKATAPESRVTCLCRPDLAPLLSRAVGVDGVLPLDETYGTRGWKSLQRNAKRLRAHRFHLGFCLPPSFGSAFMLWRAGVKRRIGYASDHRRLFLTESRPYLPNGRRAHRVEGYLALLECVWRNPTQISQVTIDPGDESRRDAVSLLQQFGVPTGPAILAIGPGSAQPSRIWFTERYRAIASRWLDSRAGVVIALGSHSEQDLCARALSGLDTSRAFTLAGRASILQTTAILELARVYLGNDSGLAHLAAAVGAPTVVISGPGDPNEVEPRGRTVLSVKEEVFCAPCYRGYCWRTDHPLECLDKVTTEEVWHQIDGMSQQTPDPRSRH